MDSATHVFNTTFRVLGPGTPTGIFLLAVLIVGIVVAVVVCIADASFHFLPSNPFAGPSAAARAGKLFWTDSNQENENLVVPAQLSPTTAAANYSMSIQLVVGDTRTPNIGMFRHIIHRGSNMCNLPITQNVGKPPVAGPTGHAGIRAEDVSGNSSSANGLPALMNPGIMMDQYKNDIHVFIHTKGQNTAGHTELWLESLTLEDMPLNTPITVGVICNGRALEVYFNCRLYSTLLLRGTPITLSPENSNWFGRCCAYPVSGLIKNLQLWGDALGPNDYAQVCKTSGGPDPKHVPSTCPTATGSRPNP